MRQGYKQVNLLPPLIRNRAQDVDPSVGVLVEIEG